MAVAALDRLGLADQIAEALDPSAMLPQVAQGALAAECREDDGATLDAAAFDRARAEPRRGRCASAPSSPPLGGGCDLPVGAHVTADPSGWRCEGLIADVAGATVLRHTELGDDPVALGALVAAVLLGPKGGSAPLNRS